VKTGKGGVHNRKERLPKSIRELSRDRKEKMVQDLLDANFIVQAKGPGSNIPQWLDVPDGQFATGNGAFAQGATVPMPGDDE
jgi:hypothetical protein